MQAQFLLFLFTRLSYPAYGSLLILQRRRTYPQDDKYLSNLYAATSSWYFRFCIGISVLLNKLFLILLTKSSAFSDISIILSFW